MIAWASQQPGWAIGFGDEVWWSRFALPAAAAWQSRTSRCAWWSSPGAEDQPRSQGPGLLRCVVAARDVPRSPDRSQMWLRFVTGRPVSAITIQFLEWCCAAWKAGQDALAPDLGQCLLAQEQALYAAGSAPTTAGQADWAKGVRILPFLLPTQSPWLNPIEPKWVHGKRSECRRAQRGGLSAKQMAERICAYFGCSYEPHLVISEQVA